jgi:BON domain
VAPDLLKARQRAIWRRERREMAMADRPAELDPYLPEHVRDALANDPRVGELGVQVVIRGGQLILSGTVSSPERQAAAAEIARGLAPGLLVVDEIIVADYPEPTETDVEHLP